MKAADHPPEPNCYCLGLDVGKMTDPSALALLRRHQPPTRPWADWRPIYAVPLLVRWPLGTPFLTIAQQVARFHVGPLLREQSPVLVLDETGVGLAVAELIVQKMRAAGVRRGHFCGVTITGGSAVTLVEGGSRWRVAKKHLASILSALLGRRRLRIAPDLPEARTLKDELSKFSVKITDAGNEQFESWREQDHDDLVLAVALAAWGAETLDLFKPGARR